MGGAITAVLRVIRRAGGGDAPRGGGRAIRAPSDGRRSGGGRSLHLKCISSRQRNESPTHPQRREDQTCASIDENSSGGRRSWSAGVLDAQLNGNLLDDLSGPGVLAVDPSFFNVGPIVLTVQGDTDPLAFNSLVDFFLPGGVGLLELVLGGGATWLSVGSVVPISADSFGLVATSTRVEISLSPREFIGVDLGDVGGGTNWLIELTGVDGPLTLSIGIVPEPASLALLLAGIGTAGARR